MEKLIWSAVEVVSFTGLGRTTIWRLEQRGEFPARRQITPQRVGWLVEEVREWARTRPTSQTFDEPEPVTEGEAATTPVP